MKIVARALVFVADDLGQIADGEVEPGQFADRVGLVGRVVAVVLVAVEEDAELLAPVPRPYGRRR